MTKATRSQLLKTYKRNTKLIELLTPYLSFSHPVMQYLYRNSIHPDAIQAMEDKFYELLAEDMLLNAERLSL